MIRAFPLAALTCALLAAFPAHAADPNTALLKELKALKARVAELEKKQATQDAALAAAPATPAVVAATPAPVPTPAPVARGMTEEQQQEFNRIAVKTEALEDARDMAGLKGLKVAGYMDPTWVFNQRRHSSGAQFLNSVDQSGYYYDTSYIGTVALDFVKETDSGARWHLTLVPQRSTQAVSEGSSSPVQEASVSIPITDLQTRFIAGHLPDWSGYEMLQPTLNKLVTHNLLFDMTLPASYTGAGMELTRDKWIIKALVGNMAASKRNANEKTPVFAYRVDYAKGEFQGFGFAGIHGRARNYTQNVLDGSGEVVDQPDSMVDTFEADAYFIRGPLTLQGQVAWGRQRKASITPAADGSLRDASWTGLSGLFAYKLEPWLEGVVRVDHIFNSRNGGGLLTYASADPYNGIGPAMAYDAGSGGWVADNPDKGVSRTALTLGMNYNYNLNTLFKLEYRLDSASGRVFLDEKNGSYNKTNQLVSSAVVVSF